VNNRPLAKRSKQSVRIFAIRLYDSSHLIHMQRQGHDDVQMPLNSRSTLITGATIWSGTSAAPDHSSIAIADGIIVAFDGDALEWAATVEHEAVDLAGGFLMPSFGEGHAHPLFGALEADGPRVRACTNLAEIIAEVRRWAEENPDEAWIRGASYDSSFAPDGLFDARWLDDAVADRPVVLRSWDYHTYWCNSRALQLAGIDSATPEPPLGEIPRRPDGSPLGTLREWGATGLMDAVSPQRSLGERVAALHRATTYYASLGFTWIQDAWVEPADIEVYLEAAAQGLLATRCNLALRADPQQWPQQRAELIAARTRIEDFGDPLLTADTVKFFADGVVENATADLLEAYSSDPHSHGMAVWAPEALADAVRAMDAELFQVHIHTIGDAAVRSALDAIENAVRHNGQRDRRPVLTHVQLVDPADIPRFAELGVIVNAQPYWAQLDDLMTVLTIPRLGDARTERQYPLETLRASGVTLSFGSDWPCSTPRPFDGIRVATTRQTVEDQPIGGWSPAERLSLEHALSAYTAGVASQAFADLTERPWGTLAVGHSADLAALDRDPRRNEPGQSLADVTVLRTWLRGHETFVYQPFTAEV